MAKTNWWLCAGCGFKNQPHSFRKDNAACENCGADRDKPENPDYDPAQLAIFGGAQ